MVVFLLVVVAIAPASTLLVSTMAVSPVPRASRHPVPKCALPDFDAIDTDVAIKELLLKANLTAEPVATEEMSAGFCNWVYRVDVPGSGPVVVKLFSPLAQMRLAPEERGAGDEEAGAEGLGPRMLYRCPDGLICDFIEGDTLTESDMHLGTADLANLIAPRLAALHGAPLADSSSSSSGGGGAAGEGGCAPVLWQFLHAMIAQIAKAPHALPPGFTLESITAEVERMRTRCDALELPIVRGHGDLKPSNVMRKVMPEGVDDEISFIDFELAGRHYRGYDLFKLFRTSGPRSTANMRSFLTTYLRSRRDAESDAETPAGGEGAGGAAPTGSASSSTELASLALDELIAEAKAAEPMTWLEAAVFFLFAICVYPAQSHEWLPLAVSRWEGYLQSAATIDADGDATIALLSARAKRREAHDALLGDGQTPRAALAPP